MKFSSVLHFRQRNKSGAPDATARNFSYDTLGDSASQLILKCLVFTIFPAHAIPSYLPSTLTSDNFRHGECHHTCSDLACKVQVQCGKSSRTPVYNGKRWIRISQSIACVASWHQPSAGKMQGLLLYHLIKIPIPPVFFLQSLQFPRMA